MKYHSTLARLTGLCLLAMAASSQAAATNVITVLTAPHNFGAVITGEGPYANGASATLTASTTNGFYVFENWTVKGQNAAGGTITDNPYTFTVTKNETLTANFAQLEYTIATGSFPTNGGTISGGGKKSSGASATLKATAKPGFVFEYWTTVAGGSPITANPYKFTVGDDDVLVAHFKDTQGPTLKIIAPAASEEIGTAAFAIKGSASDNAGVAAVYYNLNGAGWVLASNVNQFAIWYAYVTLTPDSVNTLAAYAVNDSGIFSITNTVRFACVAAGLAPLSIAGQKVMVEEAATGGNTNYPSYATFDSATYVRWSAFTNNASEVGTYTYTPTGPNTAEFVPQHVLPPQVPDNNGSVLELTFTDAYTATYTNQSGGSGDFYFAVTQESVPPTLDGVVVVTKSYYGGSMTTKIFGGDAFTNEEQGGNSSGTYTFTPFTSEDALLVQAYADPTSMVGETNYLVLMFTVGASPASGVYSSTVLSASGVVSLDTGTFTTTSVPVANTFWGPATLAGLQATITPEGEHTSFTRSYGRGTFADISTTTTEPTDVGIYLANTHASMTTGFSTIAALAPPYAVGQDDETAVVIWESSAGTSSTASNVVSGATAAVTYAKANNNAPAALSGQSITVKATSGKATTISFTNNLFKASGAEQASGTYTYAPYTPTMALVEFAATGASSNGPDLYLLLNYESPASGAFVSAEVDASSAGGWKFKEGSFTMK